MLQKWVEELRSALEREFGPDLQAMVLATRDASGAPHARSMICQRIDDEGLIYTATDVRTRMDVELRNDPRAEVLFWMPRMQLQFRISGEVRIVAFPEDESLRREFWRQMSDQARSQFFWPTPGIAVDPDDAYAQAVSADVPPPQHFEVLILEPRLADRLSLATRPHRRRVWRADAKWSGVDVNP